MVSFHLNCGHQNYDWGKLGSSSSVARFAKASDASITIDEAKPYAELWMGTHPSLPSTARTKHAHNGQKLSDYISEDPSGRMNANVVEKFGSSTQLPFLFKVLSIEKVLSIQAHPDKKLAGQLHANDPKNYPDDNHKPEMAIAVTDFEGFCGFKPLEQVAQALQFREFRDIVGDDIAAQFTSEIVASAVENSPEDLHNRTLLQQVFGKLMNTDEKVVQEKAALLVERAEKNPQSLAAIDPRLAELILRLNKQFPNDIGLFCGCLLLNHVALNVGEAMFLQAKDPHAYISGDIIECMAASDNVVRAGFTPKFKDVKNLVEMLTYSYGSVEKQKMPHLPWTRASGDAKNVLYDPPIAEFAVLQTVLGKGSEKFEGVNGPSIIIVTEGRGSLRDGEDVLELDQGLVVFVSAGSGVEVEGEGLTMYRAFVE